VPMKEEKAFGLMVLDNFVATLVQKAEEAKG
jgi:hypothetical protein